MFLRILAMLCLLACGLSLAAQESHRQTELWNVSFTGAESYSTAQLEAQLDLPEEFDLLRPERKEFIMKLSKGNLEDFYLSSGYFSSHVELNISKKSSPDTLLQIFHFHIVEGVRYHFRSARFLWAPEARMLIDDSRLSVSNGRIYNASDISDDLQYIRQLYRRNGYLHIKADHVEYLDTMSKAIDIEYVIDPGAQVKMGRFHSRAYRSGQKSAADSIPESGLSDTTWLNEMWSPAEGQVIDGKFYNDFRTKLFSTQLFSQVRLEDTLRSDGSGLSDITLTVTERVPGETRYGAFFEESYGFGVSSFSRHRNLFGAFNEGSISTMVAQNRQELVLGYANPLLFGMSIPFIPTAIRFDDRIFLDHEKLPAPTNPDSLVERWKAENRGDLTFGLYKGIRFRNTYDVSYIRKKADDILSIKGEVGLDFDFTDDSYMPTKGFRFWPTFGVGGKLEANSQTGLAVSSVFPYSELTSAIYFPIYGPLFGALGGSWGRVYDTATQDDAEIFYQGGGRSVRGYRFRSIYPSKAVPAKDSTEEDGLAAGQTPRYYRLNEELRWDLPWKPVKNFQLVQFLDWARVEDADPCYTAAQDLALGLGIRYKWQFLTVRLDYTFQKEVESLTPEPFSLGRITFDLSQAI